MKIHPKRSHSLSVEYIKRMFFQKQEHRSLSEGKLKKIKIIENKGQSQNGARACINSIGFLNQLSLSSFITYKSKHLSENQKIIKQTLG